MNKSIVYGIVGLLIVILLSIRGCYKFNEIMNKNRIKIEVGKAYVYTGSIPDDPFEKVFRDTFIVAEIKNHYVRLLFYSDTTKDTSMQLSSMATNSKPL